MKNLFRHSCVVQKLTNTQLATGTFDPTYSTRLASIDCLLQHKVLRNFDQFGKLTVRKVVKMFCEYSTTGSDLGDELVTNGGFTGNADGWTLGGDWGYSSGEIVLNATESGIASQTDDLDVVIGRTYIITINATVNASTSVVATVIGKIFAVIDGTNSYDYVASSSGIEFAAGVDGVQRLISSISVKDKLGTSSIIESDRVVVASGNFAGTYEILGITDAGGQAHHLELMLELVD